MTQNQMKRRSRPRTNGRKSGHGPSRGGKEGHDGNRMDPKSRNNARQMLDKYKSMARDALQSNDRVQSEYYFQHAEHYQRVINEIEEANKARDEQRAKTQNNGRAQDDNRTSATDVEGVENGPQDVPSVEADASAPKPRSRTRTRKPVDVAAEIPVVAEAPVGEVVLDVADEKPRPRTRKPAAKPRKAKPSEETAEDAA